jgi:hypothetical protein
MTEAEVIDRINSTIKKNGKNAITGDEMNFVLKAIIQLIADSGGVINWGDIEGTIADQLDLIAALNNKVNVVSGKGLSTNDFTNTLKSKLDGIQAGAEVNVNADWNAISGDAQILNKPDIPNPANFVAKADYTPAHSVLVQQSGTGSPTAVQIGNNEFLGRKSGGGADIEGLSVSEAQAILGIGAWIDYSSLSTIVGWSSFTTTNIFYKYLSEDLIMVIFSISGTSNSVDATFTLPFSNTNGYSIHFQANVSNNGAANLGRSLMTSGNLVDIRAGVSGGAFTASGTKSAFGQFLLPI